MKYVSVQWPVGKEKLFSRSYLWSKLAESQLHVFVLCTNDELTDVFASLLQAHAHSSLVYLVSLLGSVEHSFHHTLLLEIRALTDRYPALLGGCGKDVYRMSNSFTAMARLLGRRLEESTAVRCRLDRKPVYSCTAFQ